VNTEPSKTRHFVLNRKQQSYVLIYGDSEEKEVSKLIWSALGTSDLRIENSNDIQSFTQLYSESILTFVVVDERDDDREVIDFISKNYDLANDTFGVAYQADTDRRIHLMSQGFDAVFNRNMMQNTDFKGIIFKKVEKAKIRQTNRIMQDEYLRFRAALTASPDALIVFDNDRNIFFVSAHYKRAYPNIANRLIRGVSVEEAFELARLEEGIIESDPRYTLLKDFWYGLSGQIEFMSMNGRNKGRIWRMKASSLLDSSGVKQGTIVTTTDITDIQLRKQELEETSLQLSQALEKEQESSLLQKQFIGMVSHEFRTPLAIIDGHAQVIMRRSDLDYEAIKARCKTIRSAVSRLVSMMESILSSNMLKNGHMDPDPEEFDLSQLIQQLCEEQAELAGTHHITCDVSGAHTPVRLDRKMMTLILSNLLSNAVKFTKESPQITVTAATDTEKTMIQVSDNGIGIPQDEMGKIFERYYRASTSTGIPGTGIGLNLVQELLRLQKGQISVESWIGVGTTFTITLRNLN